MRGQFNTVPINKVIVVGAPLGPVTCHAVCVAPVTMPDMGFSCGADLKFSQIVVTRSSDTHTSVQQSVCLARPLC